MPNNFTVQWKNRQDEHGVVMIDVTVSHDEGVIPTRTISRSYAMESELCDSEFLESESIKIIDQVVDEWESEQIEEAPPE